MSQPQAQGAEQSQHIAPPQKTPDMTYLCAGAA